MSHFTAEDDAQIVEWLRAGLRGPALARRIMERRPDKTRDGVLARASVLRRRHGIAKRNGPIVCRWVKVPVDLADWLQDEAEASNVPVELMLSGIIKDAMHEGS